jgi:hypothetical protein
MTMRRRLLVCVQVIACMGGVASTGGAQVAVAGVRPFGLSNLSIAGVNTTRPPLEPLRIGGEVIVGNLTGIGGYFLGNAIGNHIASRWPDQNEHTTNFITTGFAYTGAAFATAGGVYAIGTLGDQRGSFSATMLGTGVGAGAAWVLDHTLFSENKDNSSDASRMRWAQTLLNSLLPSIGATIGFNSSRRFK